MHHILLAGDERQYPGLDLRLVALHDDVLGRGFHRILDRPRARQVLAG
jgi:hypothetical protein